MSKIAPTQVVFVELSFVCNKNCLICDIPKLRATNKKFAAAPMFMPIKLVKSIAAQIPLMSLCKLHLNGEPLLYPDLHEALQIFKNQIRSFNTNAKLIYDRADEIINNMETVVISVYEGDSWQERQFEEVKKFILTKGHHPPVVVVRCMGNVDNKLIKEYEALGCAVVWRAIRAKDGYREYGRHVQKPEQNLCMEMLCNAAIYTSGNVAPCCMIDVDEKLILGNLYKKPLYDIWYGKKRMHYLKMHAIGKRDLLPGCDSCDYWGLPV